jgi:hypothetical protein
VLGIAIGLLPAGGAAAAASTAKRATAGAETMSVTSAAAKRATHGAAATSVTAAAVKRTTCSTAAFRGDKRLGPKLLPNAGPVAKLLQGWKRLAGLAPTAYLRRYYDAKAKSWRYPPKGGYELTPLGDPIVGPFTFLQGQLIDRFGSEGGTYLSPQGSPYSGRGIPPESLNPFPGGRPCNYYRYRVLKPFGTDSGPIAPALGQPGFGLQYVLAARFFPGVTERVNVAYLLANGYIQRVGAPAYPAPA